MLHAHCYPLCLYQQIYYCYTARETWPAFGGSYPEIKYKLLLGRRTRNSTMTQESILQLGSAIPIFLAETLTINYLDRLSEPSKLQETGIDCVAAWSTALKSLKASFQQSTQFPTAKNVNSKFELRHLGIRKGERVVFRLEQRRNRSASPNFVPHDHAAKIAYTNYLAILSVLPSRQIILLVVEGRRISESTSNWARVECRHGTLGICTVGL